LGKTDLLDISKLGEGERKVEGRYIVQGSILGGKSKHKGHKELAAVGVGKGKKKGGPRRVKTHNVEGPTYHV